MRISGRCVRVLIHSFLLKGYIRLQIAMLSAFPALADAQILNRNYHDESFGGSSGEVSWKALAVVLILVVLGLWGLTKSDEKQRKHQNEERGIARAQAPETTSNKELKDFHRRNYEATKLVYAEPRYVLIFNKYPESRRNEHLAEIAGFIDELSDTDKFFERLKAMPPEERELFREEVEARMGRKVELLKRVYRELN